MEETKEVKETTPTEQDKILVAQALAERIEKANIEYKALLDRAEKLKVTEILSGKSEAGAVPKTQDELYQEKANRLLSRFK